MFVAAIAFNAWWQDQVGLTQTLGDDMRFPLGTGSIR